jgi:AraC-like DNA-binding protein
MNIKTIPSITAFHRIAHLPQPEHPLISVVDYERVNYETDEMQFSIKIEYYSIAMKRNIGAKLRFGQTTYDFDEGVMSFMAPGQVLRIEPDPVPSPNKSGYLLLIHPDFLWNSPLGKQIRKYKFFDYAIHEALFLSEREENTIVNIFQQIRGEYQNNIDQFSQELIVSQLELLLKYADRFYHRQFLTRKITGYNMLDKVTSVINDWLEDDEMMRNGLPSVEGIAAKLNLSANYLSNLLKVNTGQTTQQLIHHKLIEKAKEDLLGTSLSISEIAYQLGFEHSQSFSKLFKNKTGQSPIAFRAGFKKS